MRSLRNGIKKLTAVLLAAILLLPAHSAFAQDVKSFPYIKGESIFTCDFEGITDGAVSVDSSTVPRIYAPFLEADDKVFRAQGKDGSDALLMQTYEKEQYPTLRFYPHADDTNISSGIVTVEADIKMSSKKDEMRMAEGMAGLGVILGADGKICGEASYPGNEWFNLKIALNFYTNEAEIYYNDTYVTKKAISGSFCPQYFTLQLWSRNSTAPSLVVDNVAVYKSSYGLNDMIASTDFTGYQTNDDQYAVLDNYVKPRLYIPALNTAGCVFRGVQGKNGTANSAFYMQTGTMDQPLTLRFYVAEEYKNITSGKYVLKMNLKLGATVDQFRLSEGFGIGFSDSNIFGANGTVLGTAYSADTWYDLEVLLDYDTMLATVMLDGKRCGTKALSGGLCTNSGNYFTFQLWSKGSEKASVTIDDFGLYKAAQDKSDAVSYYADSNRIYRIQRGNVKIITRNYYTRNLSDFHTISVLRNKETNEIADIKAGSGEETVNVPDGFGYNIETYIIKEGGESILQQIDLLTDSGTKYLSGKTVISDVKARYPNNQHPRIIFTQEKLDSIKSDLSGETYRNILSSITYRADIYLNSPVCEYKLTGVALLNVSREVVDKVMALSMMYLLNGDERYAERAYTELAAAAAFTDWNPKHFLDVAEMSAAFAFGYDWLYNYLTPQRREVLRNAMVEKGLNQVMQDYTDAERTRTYRWYQDIPGDNWKFVCNGGLSMVALALCDEVDETLCANVLTYAFGDTFDAVRRMYSASDGSYSEGLTYWTYASNFLAYYSSALESAAGTDYGLTDYIGLEKSCYFVKNLSSNIFYSFNFGDAYYGGVCSSVFLWYGHRFKKYDLSAMRADYAALHPMDLLWYSRDEYASQSEQGTEYGEVCAPNAAFRSSWDKMGLYAAIHFGENDAYHGHADMGTFVLEYKGRRFFTDFGQEDYSLSPYYGTYRYRAEGHNTLVFNPSTERDQVNSARCYINKFKSTSDGGFAICNMSDAYNKTVVRGMKLSKSGNYVILQDEIKALSSDKIYWFAHTPATIDMAQDSKSAVLTVGNARIWVGILSENMSFEIMDPVPLPTSPVIAGQRVNEGKKLAIINEGSESYTISVAFMPLADSEAAPADIPKLTALKSW